MPKRNTPWRTSPRPIAERRPVKPTSRVYIAGHQGLVGSAILRHLRKAGYRDLVTRGRSELDLTSQPAVERFFEQQRPEYIFLAAARVGGVLANSTYPAEFIRDNLLIQTNVIDAAFRYGVRKFLFLGSSCVYPKHATQPMTEDQLLSGLPEPSNESYAIAKIAGIKMAQAYRRQHGFPVISLMPTNLYGPGDNFDLETSHVVPALIRKFHEAEVSGASPVTVWGTGNPRREFLYVEDLADAVHFLMLNYDSGDIINVGTGQDVSIAELAGMVAEIVGYRGEVVFDPSKPGGPPRKLLDVSRLSSLGWRAPTNLREGLERTYRWFSEEFRASG